MYFRQKGPTLCLLMQLRWKSTFNLPNMFLKAVLTASTVYTLHVLTRRPPFFLNLKYAQTLLFHSVMV